MLRDKILTFGSILQELWAVTAYSTKSANPLPSNEHVSVSLWDELTATDHQIIEFKYSNP